MYDEIVTPGTVALFDLFGLPVYPYALLITLGALCALLMALNKARKTGVCRDAVLTFPLFAIPLAVILGRAVFIACRVVDLYDYGFSYAFKIWYGGFSVIGVALGLGLAALITARIHKISFLDLLDTVLPGLLMALAFARFGEGATTNGYGPEVTVEAFKFMPLSRMDEYGDYTYSVFIGQALTALIASVYTQTLSTRRGDAAGKGLVIVAAAQIVWESARRDSVLRFDFIRWGMVFAGVILLVILVLSLRLNTWKAGRKALLSALFAVLVVICIMMEFFIDGKFIQEIPIWACYLCDAACAAGIGAIVIAALTAPRKVRA